MWKDLAPDIFRQRLVIEGFSSEKITGDVIEEYLSRLSNEIGMIPMGDPRTSHSPKFGMAGWIHWETSGAHMYSWDENLFFSVDIYTCKEFSVDKAVKFTKEFFNCREIEFKGV